MFLEAGYSKRLQRTPTALVCPVSVELREVEAVHRLYVLLAHALFPVSRRPAFPFGVKFPLFPGVIV